MREKGGECYPTINWPCTPTHSSNAVFFGAKLSSSSESICHRRDQMTKKTYECHSRQTSHTQHITHNTQQEGHRGVVYLVNKLVKGRAKSRIGHIPLAQVIFSCNEVPCCCFLTAIITTVIIAQNAISQRIHQTCLSNSWFVVCCAPDQFSGA